MRINGLIALAAVFSSAACTSSTDVPDSVELNYSIYSVNGQSPAAKTQFDISGNKISIPRGSILLHKDGTVMEILQYVVTRQNGIDAVSSTDTTYGHYEHVSDGYDIRLPNSFGSESFSGSLHPATDLMELSRSWKKNEFTVGVNIVYAKVSSIR